MGKQHEKKNTRHRKSVWWEDREKWARKGQIQEEARTTNRWTLPGWKWCVQIALAQRRCDRREDHGILIWGKGSTGRQSPNKREGGCVGVKSLWRGSYYQQDPSTYHQQEGCYTPVLRDWWEHFWLWHCILKIFALLDLAAKMGAARRGHQASKHWLGQLFPIVATPVFSAAWTRLRARWRMEGGLWGGRWSVWHVSFPHELHMGNVPSESITCLCQVLLLLHEEVKAKPLLMLEKAQRTGRGGVSPLLLVSLGKDPHKHQWTLKSGSQGDQTRISILPLTDKKAVLYADQSCSCKTRLEQKRRFRYRTRSSLSLVPHALHPV